MLSRLGQSISRASHSRNVLSGRNGGGAQILTDSSVYQSRYEIRQADDKVGAVLRRCLGSLAPNNQRNGSVLSSTLCLSDINSVLANPRNGRFFSSEAPKKKNDDNFYPNEKKETPKGNDQKSESKEGSSREDTGNFGPREEKQNVLGGGHGRRSQTLTSSVVYQSLYIRRADDSLWGLKCFLGSLTANNERNGSGLLSKVCISDSNSVLGNHRIRRFISSNAPEKKNDDDFYSKEKKKTPNGNNQKSESKKETSTDDSLFYMLVTAVVLYCLINRHEETEIDICKLERLLKEGLVDYIVINNNKPFEEVAKVYVRDVPHDWSTKGSITGINSRAKHYIKIWKYQHFEQRLRKVQAALSKNYHHHVPVLSISK